MKPNELGLELNDLLDAVAGGLTGSGPPPVVGYSYESNYRVNDTTDLVTYISDGAARAWDGVSEAWNDAVSSATEWIERTFDGADNPFPDEEAGYWVNEMWSGPTDGALMHE